MTQFIMWGFPSINRTVVSPKKKQRKLTKMYRTIFIKRKNVNEFTAFGNCLQFGIENLTSGFNFGNFDSIGIKHP